MRKIFVAAGAVLALGAATAGGLAVVAQAQPAPPGMPMGIQDGPHGPAMGGRPGWGAHMHPPGGGWMHRGRMAMMRLIYPTDDRALTGADVQKIAEAYLLWNGNRTWKVSGVTENQDNTVSFAFSAPDGTMIARFSVDRKSGHFHRLG